MTTFKGIDFLYGCIGAGPVFKVSVDLARLGDSLTWFATINCDPEFLELRGNACRGHNESERAAVVRSVSNAIDIALDAG